eukprot:CAMPEP_0170760382 /NCGR_PEP_ID=MMETSP0733-20121128/1522_1 /TAXON_ID=186038 /ORGANISM="Fragilariopsis kerguelensis, Strain L26-C5" /LENGTH=193 /DNA_ID=CAMNT_0011100123 /DNA_START=131 /DNA_END=711 /DNA_ORIENTATION=-
MKTQNAFDDFWFVGFLAFVFVGGLRVSVPGLEPSTTFDRSSSLWLGNDMPVDMLLPWDDSTVMVARGWGRAGVPPMVATTTNKDLFQIAVAWKKSDGIWAAALEAIYENVTMSHGKYSTLPSNNNNSVSSPFESANARSAPEDSAASHNISLCWHGLLVALSLVVRAMLDDEREDPCHLSSKEYSGIGLVLST